MNGFNIDSKATIKEINEFTANLKKSYKLLTQLKNSDIEVGITPYEVIYSQDKLQLRYYAATTKNSCKTPLLICYALVNRPYMIDLEPERSVLQRLLEQGLDVYLIDWGYPDITDRFLDLDDYINDYIDSCVNAVCTHAQSPQTNLLGICQGGTLSLCYTALHPEKINSLITMVTPVDFQTEDNRLYQMAKYIDVDLAVDTYGNIPGILLNLIYNSLLPMRLGVQKFLNAPVQLANKKTAASFLRMEKWIYDSPDQAGEAFRQFVIQFFQQNLLVKGQVKIGNQLVNLKNIYQPVLNIYATQDHLVPPKASIALKHCISSQFYEEAPINSGHIGIFVSGKSQTQVAPKIAEWLKSQE